MKALVLTGGFGTRLKEVIHDRPKVLAPINGKPFLEFVLEMLIRNGCNEVVISIGYLGDYIRNYFGEGESLGIKISYSMENYPLGTGGAVKLAEELFDETFIIVNGDTLVNTDLDELIEFHRKKKASVTVALAKRRKEKDVGLVLKTKGGRIKRFLEKPEAEKNGFINAGLYIFEPSVLKQIKKGKRFSLENDFFPSLAIRGRFYGFEIKEDFIDIGTPELYEKAKEILKKQKRLIIESKAPVRISFVGGGTDLPSYFLKDKGEVVSSTINRYSHITIKEKNTARIRIVLKDFKKEEVFPLGKVPAYDNGIFDIFKAAINRLNIKTGVDIIMHGDFPTGSGLGSSSATCVSLVGALLRLKGERVNKNKVARLAIEIERGMLKIPGGWQDQIASTFGGFNFIEFLPGGKFKITPLRQREKIVKKLEDNLMLFYIGAKRTEAEQQRFLEANLRRSSKTKEALNMLKRMAVETRRSLERKEIEHFGKLLDKAWLFKEASNPKVTTPLVNKMYDLAMKKGAYGGKLLGAGGGGCLLICAPPRRRKPITKILEKEGARLLAFKFEFDGLQVKVYEN